jgi:hypothetical protein
MPSPFPGMDPFIEGQVWEDFHHEFISDLRALLLPSVRPRYAVRVEHRIYVEYQPGEPDHFIRSDVSVIEEHRRLSSTRTGGAATAIAVEPITLTLPMPERRRTAFLTVRDRATMEVVTVVEVLSPVNKRPRSAGRRKYLRKRGDVLESTAHLVEVDLLRGGARLPMVETLPPAHYYAFVSREQHRPKAGVYAWSLNESLPAIPIPLAEGDQEVLLNLQEAFTAAYDRAGYDYSIDYHRPVEPSLDEADAAWVREVVSTEI